MRRDDARTDVVLEHHRPEVVALVHRGSILQRRHEDSRLHERWTDRLRSRRERALEVVRKRTLEVIDGLEDPIDEGRRLR